MKRYCQMIAIAGLLLAAALMFSACSGCYYRNGARVTPEFTAARGAKVYLHAPRDKALVSRMEPVIRAELRGLGFSLVDNPADCDIMAYYYYSYDLQEPAYVHDFMIVFKPFPGDRPELMASASCYHPCSSTAVDRANPGLEVHKAFSALRKKFKPVGSGCN